MNALPAIYDGHLVHVRRDPMVRVFRHRVHMWFVDLDELPVLPRWLRPLASFRAADHFGEPGRAIKENVEVWLRTRNVELDGGRATMLTCARMFGHVFNPLTVYWCHRPDGELRCVIAEVHNTYGERHCYLLWPTSSAIHHVSKQFQNGYITVPDTPGLGFGDIDEELLRRHLDPRDPVFFAATTRWDGESSHDRLWS